MPKILNVSSDDDESEIVTKVKSKKEKPREPAKESSSESDQESDPDQGNGQWEVDFIMGHKVVKGEVVYHVQWKLKPGQTEDWSDSENWVREKNMSADVLTKQYWILQKNKGNKRARRDSTASSGGDRKSGSPKRKPRTNDLEGFVVSDDEVDPPPKKNHHKKKRRSRTPSPDSELEIVEETSSKKPQLIHAHEIASDSSSLSDFIASDTEEGVMIPTRIKKNRTPSPMVVSHRKKPTWQENLHLTKDNYFLDKNDDSPIVLTDDEERGQAILIEAEMDEAQKEAQREKSKKKDRTRCKESPVRRRARISSSSSSESEDDSSPPPRRRYSSNPGIHVDAEAIRAQQKKRMAKDAANSWKRDRHVIDYRSFDLQSSGGFFARLKHQLKDRRKNPGVWKAKESISAQVDKQCNGIKKISLSTVTPSSSKDVVNDILTALAQPHAMAPKHPRDSNTSKSNCVVIGSRNESLQTMKTKKNHTRQFNGHRGDVVLSASSTDTRDMVYNEMRENSPKKVVRQPMEPVYVTGSEPREPKAKKNKKTAVVVEPKEKDPLEAEHCLPKAIDLEDAPGEEIQNHFDSDVIGEDNDMMIIDEAAPEPRAESEDSDTTTTSTGGIPSGENLMAGKTKRPIITEVPEDFESLSPDHPLYDVFERFAEECWLNKYEAVKNGLKPVFIIQFFCDPEGEGDWCMVVFENKPGQKPLHVCECVDTNYMLDIEPQLVIDCEDRLAKPDVHCTMELIITKWKEAREREKKAEARKQKKRAQAQ